MTTFLWPGVLYFHRCVNNNCDLYWAASDASSQGLLYQSGVNDLEPRISPDGTTVLFYQMPVSGSNGDIFTIDFAGNQSSLDQITDSTQREAHASWSPNGASIAFSRGVPGKPWVMDADGGNQRQLVFGGESHGVMYGTDGRIYFQSYNLSTPTYDIYRVDIDGRNLELLFRTDNASEGYPALSPIDSLLLFTRKYATGSNGSNCITTPCYSNIWVRDLNSNKETQLTNTKADDISPVWSPDGRSIAFSSNIDGDFEVYTMDLVNLKWKQITFNTFDDTVTSWSFQSR